MAIKDVSRQWAAMMESDAAEDKKYTEACESACEAMAQAEIDEIDNFDEEEIDPAECGFAEAEEQVDEVVDPMQMWKDMKNSNEAPKKNVKVDAKYIDTMKKLLSKIKSSKAQLYNTVIGKLEAYKAAGTELPPPEDYAENFIPFEMIQKVIGGKEDAADNNVEGDDDAAMLAGRKFATDRSAAEYGDTDNAFGNSDAEANMYDSEITEDEAEEAKKEVDAIIKKELKAAGGSKPEIKEWLSKNKTELNAAIGKIKSKAAQDSLKRLTKFLEKYSDGKLDEAKTSDGHIVPIAKGVWKILKIVLGCGLMGVAGLSFGISKLSGAIDGISKKLGNKLLESLTLEIADDEELKEKEDAEELAEDGCTKKEKEEEKIDEADDREPASHLLDAVGVKASTASLKGQDTAMISVVEMLMKKIDKLESKLEEAKLNEYGHQRYDLSKKGGTISKAIVNHIEELKPEVLQDQKHAAELLAQWFAEEKVDTPYSRKVLKEIEFLPKFSRVSNIISYLMNMLGSGMGNKMTYGRTYEAEGDELPEGPEEWDFDDEGMTAEDRKNYEEAVKIQDASYRRELTKAEEDKFRKLLDKLPDIAKDHLLSNMMGPNGFARPGDVPLLNDPTVYADDGGGDGMGGYKKANVDFDKKVPIAPFLYKQGSHRTSAAEERKAAKEQAKKDQEKRRLAGRFPARGKKDADGKKGLWSGAEWKAMVASLQPKEKKELLNSIIDEIQAEGKAQGKDPRQIASEVAFTKEHFGDKIDSRDFAQMLYGVTDIADIGRKRVGIDKYARTVIDIIQQAFKAESDPKKIAELIDANLNTIRNNKRSKIARTPLIRGDNPLDKEGKGLINPLAVDNTEIEEESEEVDEDDVMSVEDFFSETEDNEDDKKKKETK